LQQLTASTLEMGRQILEYRNTNVHAQF
jgi:hypothetical protein